MACVSVVEHGAFPVKTGTREEGRGLKAGRKGGEEGRREMRRGGFRLGESLSAASKADARRKK
jgi:hypothetical protein